MGSLPFERFPALTSCAIPIAHAFTTRSTEIDVLCDKEEAVRRLTPLYQSAVSDLGFPWSALQTAEQVHGKELALVSQAQSGLQSIPKVDGLITATPGVLLGIMVADCGAIYVVDPIRRALALLHSGKKGTELRILPATIESMRETFGSDPSDLVIQLSPCIRPPHYEIDIPSAIRSQALECGVPSESFHDCGICTASHPDRYYSYRRELGKTGRMLALLGFPP